MPKSTPMTSLSFLFVSLDELDVLEVGVAATDPMLLTELERRLMFAEASVGIVSRVASWLCDQGGSRRGSVGEVVLDVLLLRMLLRTYIFFLYVMLQAMRLNAKA